MQLVLLNFFYGQQEVHDCTLYKVRLFIQEFDKKKINIAKLPSFKNFQRKVQFALFGEVIELVFHTEVFKYVLCVDIHIAREVQVCLGIQKAAVFNEKLDQNRRFFEVFVKIEVVGDIQDILNEAMQRIFLVALFLQLLKLLPDFFFVGFNFEFLVHCHR